MKSWFRFLPAGLLLAPAVQAAILVGGVADKTKYDTSVTINITADPNAVTTTATLDGAPIAVGSNVVVNSVRYHELIAESRDAQDVLVDSKVVRFIVRDPARNGSEDGIPVHTPYHSVNDAPSAFAGGTLKVIAPAAWPAGLPIPIATTLRASDNEPLWLNGTVTFGGFPSSTIQMRRGWGSTTVPAVSAGTIQINAQVAGLTDNPSIVIGSTPAPVDVSGTIAADTTWAANSHYHITGTVTINPGATLTIEQGVIVTIYSGNSTAGSAAEIVVNGKLQINGVAGNPVTFAPDTATGRWGGIELLATTSNVTGQHAIFTASGEHQTWFSGSSYSYHKTQQSLFLLGGSGSGTAIGARVDLTDCYFFNLGGTLANSKTNTSFDLHRCLLQRAVGGGQLNGCKVTIDRSALIEFPAETEDFVDADNDGIYLTNGDLSISNTVIGFTKDDGVDSGGSGGENPFTAVADTTPFVAVNNWFEGTFHEGNSLSGTRNVSHANSVFINCGQGVEDGYSNSGTSDGPNAVIDACLFAGNMVGVRWGDNYGSSYNYNGSMEVKNSLILYNLFKDAFSGQWHPTQANGWIYQTSATNSFGRPYFNVHDNHLSQPDAVNHPANTTWNPATHGSLIEPFMPVPGSNVGIAISSFAAAQSDISAFPGTFTVRLSTFSSKRVSVIWSVIGKSDPASQAESLLASGTLDFAPGEMFKTFAPAVANPGAYGLIRVALTNPVNAEVTGEAWYCKPPSVAGNPDLVARGATGWRYREARSEPPAEWKTLAFDDESPVATEWLAGTLPAGFGVSGVTFGTTIASGPTGDRTKAFYFRKKFTVDDPSQIATLTLNVRRDDGAVFWLNDDSQATVVSASGTFNPPFSYSGLAPNSSDSNTYFSYTIPTAKLVAGENILAVELHQTSLTSSDAILDCELLATYNTPLQLYFTSVGSQFVLYWFDAGATLEESSDLNHWKPASGVASPLPVVPSGERRFYRLKK